MKSLLNSNAIQMFIKLGLNKCASYENINQLLHTEPFEKMIIECSSYVNIENGNFNKWISLFDIALNTGQINGLSLYEKNIISSIYESKDIDLLNDKLFKIESIINEKLYESIALNYLPPKIKCDVVKIYLLFGINNAFAANGNIYIDVNMFSAFSKEFINGFIAHEIHHIYREKIIKNYHYDNKNAHFINTLRWIESEATADLCNDFKRTLPVYKKLGFIDMQKISGSLSNPNHIFLEFERLYLIDDDKTNSFLSNNLTLHLMGHIITQKIIDTMGLDAIKGIVGNSISFFNLYHKCCKINSDNQLYGFSEEFILFINALVNDTEL